MAETQARILVLCDSELILVGLVGLLSSAGYIVSAHLGCERAAADARQERFDLAVLSTDFARDDTQALIDLLRRPESPTRVLALSGDARPRGLGGLDLKHLAAVTSSSGGSLLKLVAALIRGNRK